MMGPSEKPSVTCLCPTWGRFELLRDAVACFLIQDYPFATLMILNDAPVELKSLDLEYIRIINYGKEFATLGEKREFLLNMAESRLIAHWDDDDLYLPWHLSSLVDELIISGASVCKPRASWMWNQIAGTVAREDFRPFEASLIAVRKDAARIGYDRKNSGQCLPLLQKTESSGNLRLADQEIPSYIYRWGRDTWHVSAQLSGMNDDDKARKFKDTNQDFGDEQSLIPPGRNPHTWAMERCRILFRQFANTAIATCKPPPIELLDELRNNLL